MLQASKGNHVGIDLVAGVHVGAVVEQECNHLVLAVEGRPVKRSIVALRQSAARHARRTYPVDRLGGVGSSLDEVPQGIHVAALAHVEK